jgi:O-antigen/teichoic acid export membrane protein
MLQEATNAVLIPHLSLLQQRNEPREILYLMTRAMRKLAAVYFPVCVFLALFAREFIAFLFTSRYLASVPVFLVNLMLLPFMIFLPDPLFRAYVDQRYFLIRLRILIFCLLAGGLWLGTARFGMLGAITVVVAAGALERIAAAIRFAPILKVRARDIALLKDVAKLALAALMGGASAAAMRWLIPWSKAVWTLLGCGTVFCLVYGGALLLFGALTMEEKAILRRKLLAAAAIH